MSLRFHAQNAAKRRAGGRFSPVLPPTRRDSAHLGAFRRRRSSGVRQVHGGDRRL